MTQGIRNGLRDVTNAMRQGDNVKNSVAANNESFKPGTRSKRAKNAAVVVEEVAPAAVKPEAKSVEKKGFNADAELQDPQKAIEYAEPIYEVLKIAERNPRLRADPSYLEGQLEITARMRGILLDWLVEVHYKFKLVPETLYLCINLIDRTLDRDRNIPRKKLQLVGGTCMLIASKYEEFRPPEVGDICYIMDNAYTRDDILEMEVKILNTLKFQVTIPSPLQFLEYYVTKLEDFSREDDHFFLTQYLIEVTQLEPKFLKHKPSVIGAACLYLANRIRKLPNPWPVRLFELTDLDEMETVKPLAKEIFEMVPNFRHKSLFKKYSMEKYHAVAPTIPSQ